MELEAVLFELAASNVCALPLCFCDKIANVTQKSGGHILFEIRSDGNPCYQRVAAIQYASGEIGILLLGNDGVSLATCTANGALSSFTEPLGNWYQLPLRDQATNDIRGHASLFLAAMRNAGCRPLWVGRGVPV